jgi:hypothetical protein
MRRHLASSPNHDRFILGLILVALLTLTGCPLGQTPTGPTAPGTAASQQTPPAPGPIAVLSGDSELKKAQDIFNEANKLEVPGQSASDAALAQYRQVVDIVENQVLPKVSRDDLKAQAYALEAFSKWRLNQPTDAIQAADAGKRLCAGGVKSQRDCAILQMVGGLVVASQEWAKYKDAANMSQEDVKAFSNHMDAALNEINPINGVLAPSNTLAIFANLEQLLIIREVTGHWVTNFFREPAIWKPEVLKWLSRVDQILKKFPETPYPNQDLTLQLKGEFERLRKKAEAPS